VVDDKVGRPPGELWVSKSRTDWSRSCSLGGYAPPCLFPLPSPSPVLFFSLPLPFPPFPSLFLLLYPPYLPLVQLLGLGSAGSSLNWVLGGSPSTNAFLTILTPKKTCLITDLVILTCIINCPMPIISCRILCRLEAKSH